MLKLLLVLLLNKGLLLEIVKVHRLKKDLSPVLAEREVLSNSETSGKGNCLPTHFRPFCNRSSGLKMVDKEGSKLCNI